MASGKKYVLFGGMRRPLRATAKTSSTRVARSRNAASASAAVHGRNRLRDRLRVPDPVEPVAIDELDVELALCPTQEPDAPAPIRDDARPRPWLVREESERFVRRFRLRRHRRGSASSGRPENVRCVGNT